MEAAAKGKTKGSLSARQQLQSPPFPEELEYMQSWVYELHGRSGAHMAGACPLSHLELAAWCTLRDVQLEPYEVSAIMYLDSCLLTSEEKEVEVEAKKEKVVDNSWPAKKRTN